jgi:hypothetical protein
MQSPRNLTGQLRWALFGTLFGLCFPVIGTLLESYILYDRISLDLLLTCQNESELLWIIDTAPIFLGFFASLGGRQLDVVEEKKGDQ